jgi:hypothetical protein
MTKAELIEKIAKDSGIPKTTAKVAFDSAIEGIMQGLKKRNRIGTSERPTLLKLTSICIYIKKTHFLVLKDQNMRNGNFK